MKDKENSTKIVIGNFNPETINFTVGSQSAILMIGRYTYDLRTINILQYESIVIDGVEYKKVQNER